MFSTIKNFFLGTPKAVDDVLDKDSGHLAKIGQWIGNQQFTDQEQADLNYKIGEAVQKFAVDTLDENTDRSKARREVGVFVVKFYCLLVFMGAMVFPVNPAWAELIITLSTSWGLGLLVSGVAAFFFGVHVQRGMAKKP